MTHEKSCFLSNVCAKKQTPVVTDIIHIFNDKIIRQESSRNNTSVQFLFFLPFYTKPFVLLCHSTVFFYFSFHKLTEKSSYCTPNTAYPRRILKYLYVFMFLFLQYPDTHCVGSDSCKRNFATKSFKICACPDNSSLVAALSCAVAELVCTTLAIWSIPILN